MSIIVRKGLKVIFLDVRKAYDTVPIEIAMRRLAKRLPGLGQPLLPVITSLFTNTSFRAVINGQLTVSVTRQRGLAQGSLLAPLIFNIFLNPLADHLQPIRDITADNPLSALIIADDIALFDADVPRLQQLTATAIDWLRTNGLEINSNKCRGIGFEVLHSLG